MKFMSVVNVGVTLTAITGLLAVIGHQEVEVVRLKKKLNNAKSVNNVLTRTLQQNVDLMTDDQVREMSHIFYIEKEFECLAKKHS